MSTEPLKVFPFDIDPELLSFLGIRTVLVILRTALLGLAGNARRSLGWILPTSYRARQEENAENQKYFGDGGFRYEVLFECLRTKTRCLTGKYYIRSDGFP